jgi:hypothetical protein
LQSFNACTAYSASLWNVYLIGTPPNLVLAVCSRKSYNTEIKRKWFMFDFYKLFLYCVGYIHQNRFFKFKQKHFGGDEIDRQPFSSKKS